jgi:hypothetical protein
MTTEKKNDDKKKPIPEPIPIPTTVKKPWYGDPRQMPNTVEYEIA